MHLLSKDDIIAYVEGNIDIFHEKRIKSLDSLNLKKVVRRKNPYLFRAKHMLTAAEIVKSFVDAHISSQEETLFGDWLEGLAIFINRRVYGGCKSGITGIDLEFEKESIRYIVTIKSGPHWGNSSQKAKMQDNFLLAKKTLRTGNSRLHVVAVNGCCYGRCPTTDKGDYFLYCGQCFWEFISGDSELFAEIMEPLGYRAKERNTDFTFSYNAMLNRFTRDFATEFCTGSGEIDWDRLVRFNSQV